MIYRIFAVLVFVVVIGGTIVFGGQQNETTVPTTIEEPLRDPGYAARDAKMVQTGPDGRPLYTLDADVIRQQPDDNTIQLEKATLGFYDANGSLWTARGEHGEVGQNTGKVELTGDVHVSGTPQGSKSPLEIATDRLAFDTNTKIASTRDPVTIMWSGQQIRGKGMRATLNDGRMQLESAVHGLAVPSKLPASKK
ncbi:MAG TPA: LPS export ABC transporter periplasmic protein LptC [Steroidobacteraceae bacterium]|nr:LPS export ABC transporter periplasmic protein LptC [Steroidobacteraceae bacterium]